MVGKYGCFDSKWSLLKYANQLIFEIFLNHTQANIPTLDTSKYGIFPWANQMPLFYLINGPSLDLQKEQAFKASELEPNSLHRIHTS